MLLIQKIKTIKFLYLDSPSNAKKLINFGTKEFLISDESQMYREILDSGMNISEKFGNPGKSLASSANFWKNMQRIIEVAEILESIRSQCMKNQPDESELEDRDKYSDNELKIISKTGKVGSAIRQQYYVDSQQAEIAEKRDSRLQVRLYQLNF